MRNSAAEHLDAVPSAEGGMTRLAFACAQEKGADVDTLLRKAGLSRAQIEDSHARISVRSQILFLDLVAKALDDDLLGFHLSQNFDLRMIGFLYYVMASSETLGEALGRVARYSSIVNEGFRVTVREGREIDVVLETVGIHCSTRRRCCGQGDDAASAAVTVDALAAAKFKRFAHCGDGLVTVKIREFTPAIRAYRGSPQPC